MSFLSGRDMVGGYGGADILKGCMLGPIDYVLVFLRIDPMIIQLPSR